MSICLDILDRRLHLWLIPPPPQTAPQHGLQCLVNLMQVSIVQVSGWLLDKELHPLVAKNHFP